jgi:hypothetical protein
MGDRMKPINVHDEQARCLTGHPAVLGAHMVRVSDAGCGERWQAHVTLRAGVRVTCRELHAFLAGQDVRGQLPERWVITAAASGVAGAAVNDYDEIRDDDGDLTRLVFQGDLDPVRSVPEPMPDPRELRRREEDDWLRRQVELAGPPAPMARMSRPPFLWLGWMWLVLPIIAVATALVISGLMTVLGIAP